MKKTKEQLVNSITHEVNVMLNYGIREAVATSDAPFSVNERNKWAQRRTESLKRFEESLKKLVGVGER